MDLIEEYQLLKQRVEAISKEFSGKNNLISELTHFENVLKDCTRVNEQEFQKYKMLYENAGESIFVHNEEGRIVSANSTAYKVYQYSGDELLHLSVLDIDTPEQSRYAIERIEQLMKFGQISFESVHKRKNGDYFPVDVTAQKIIWNGQNAVMSICRDISERKKAEQALNESEIKLKKIIEQISDGIIIFDRDGIVVIWNSGAEAVTGLKAEDALNRKINDVQYGLLHGKYKNRTLIDQKFNEVITFSNPEGFNKIFENEMFSEERGLIILQSIVFPIYFDQENYLFGSVIRDVTEVKEIEKQLTELNVTKDHFFSILAHDLRSPFNSILGFSKLLIENLHHYNFEETEKRVKIIYDTSLKAYNLLEEILLWAKSQTGKLNYEPQSIDFMEVCSEITESFKDRAQSKQIIINCFESEKTLLKADLNMFKTILRNLISNALKYSNINGTINIFSVKNGNISTITVSDNGIGIEEKNLSKLWGIKEHFSTLGTSREEGSGFGLVLCKEFVEKHGGTIRVESEFGKGSHFIFTMPLDN